MHVIGETKGVKLYSPNDAYFSFFNSPYFGHSHSAAIDIYPYHQMWGGPVFSPIRGKIVRIQKTKMGNKKAFPSEDYDFGIAIRPEENKETIVRILHCKPTLQEEEIVDQGDIIGTGIRSRYFNYWTGVHYHIEVMHLDNFSRSTRSYPLDLPFQFEATPSREMVSESEFIVESVNENNIIGYPKDFSHTALDQFFGLSAIEDNSKIVGILDGGLSHYKHGGVVGQSTGQDGSTISLQNHPVGVVTNYLKGASLFLREPTITCFLNEIELRGLSCFIYPKIYVKRGISPLVLVPQSYREFVGVISEGDVCKLKICGGNNTIKAE